MGYRARGDDHDIAQVQVRERRPAPLRPLQLRYGYWTPGTLRQRVTRSRDSVPSRAGQPLSLRDRRLDVRH